MIKQCSICTAPVSDEAAVLTVGGAGTPRYLCPECEAEFDIMTESLEPEEISASLERVGKKMSDANIEDTLTLKTANEIMESAAERAKAIKDGSYEPESEETPLDDEESFEEIPPEYRESEEDIELEREEEEKAKKVDKVINIVCAVVLAAALAFFVWSIGDRFWW